MTTYLLFRDTGRSPAPQIRAGDRQVWNDLVASQHGRLFNLHLRLCGDRETAADLTQETFRAAYESRASFQGRCQPATWLYSVGLNVNRNWWRKQGRQAAELPPPPGDLPDPDPSPEALALLHEQSHLVYEAVRALPEPYRETVALRYLAGVPAVELARVSGTKPETVRWRLHQGLRLLWAALTPRLGKENSDAIAVQ
jgi:RNA polymerase sigma-70 factor (ECF subfamily)